MGVLADWQIKDLAAKGMIEPFAEGQVRPGVISYGTSSYGYDVRIGYKFQVFSPINATVIDPKDFDKNAMVTVDLTNNKHHQIIGGRDYQCRHCGEELKLAGELIKDCPKRSVHLLIPPHSFALGESIETFDIPRDILVVCLGKSTYARCGLIVNVTPGEPEWKGKWTIEISNTTPLPAKVYCGEGVMQCLFFRADDKVCHVSYKDRKGKYHLQQGVTPPKV